MDKKLLIIMLATGLSLASSVTLGEAGLIPGANDPSKADLKVLTDNRSLISTKIDPSKGQAEGYVVGVDEGSFDVNDLKLFMAQLRGELKSVFQRHPEEPQFKAVTAITSTTSTPAKPTALKPKKKMRRAYRTDQQKAWQQKI